MTTTTCIDVPALDPATELELLTGVFPEAFLVAEGEQAWLSYPRPIILVERGGGVWLKFLSPTLGCHASCDRIEIIASGLVGLVRVYAAGHPRFELPMCEVWPMRPGDTIDIHLRDDSTWVDSSMWREL